MNKILLSFGLSLFLFSMAFADNSSLEDLTSYSVNGDLAVTFSDGSTRSYSCSSISDNCTLICDRLVAQAHIFFVDGSTRTTWALHVKTGGWDRQVEVDFKDKSLPEMFRGKYHDKYRGDDHLGDNIFKLTSFEIKDYGYISGSFSNALASRDGDTKSSSVTLSGSFYGQCRIRK